MTEIKFCENNFGHGTDKLVNRIESELNGVSVEVEPCLGYCGDCAMGPFALVDDELVQAETADELFNKIKEQV